MQLDTGNYRVKMDSRWELEDLYKFPRAFEQAYFAYYSLLFFDDDFTNERLAYAYSSYPWRGGYSAVNFYNQLKYSMPKPQRPTITSISYASPGWIDLNLIQEVAINVGIVVGSVCGSIRLINGTYNSIYKGMQDRKLTQLKIEKEEFSLAKENFAFLRKANIEMGGILNFTDIDALNTRTGNELRTLKILLSIYRRIRTLAQFRQDGKARLPESIEEHLGRDQ
ncbi:hypothetical protein [Roseibium sp.]|uniref:hypothetical protein n=1 Tax=Roseibium sp. TaxID=1936156 RepID=UPI003A97D658